MEVEQPTHPVGDGPVGRDRLHRRRPVHRSVPGGVELEGAVHDADVHADITPGGGAGGGAQAGSGVPGVLQRVPRGLQEQALLRVHGRGFSERDSEVQRVEQVHAVEKGATVSVGGGAVRAARRRGIPAVTRHRTEGVAAGAEHGPERIEVRRAGEAAGQAYDGDRVAKHGAEAVSRGRYGRRIKGGRRGRRCQNPPEFGAMRVQQPVRERAEVAVLEEQRTGQGSAQLLIQLAEDLHADQAVDAQYGKRLGLGQFGGRSAQRLPEHPPKPGEHGGTRARW